MGARKMTGCSATARQGARSTSVQEEQQSFLDSHGQESEDSPAGSQQHALVAGKSITAGIANADTVLNSTMASKS